MTRWRSTFRALANRETYVGPDFQRFAVLHVDRAGLNAARFGDVSRARAVDRSGARVPRFAVVRRDGGSLPKRFGARLLIRFRAKNYMAAGNFVGVEPPVLRLRRLDA